MANSARALPAPDIDIDVAAPAIPYGDCLSFLNQGAIRVNGGLGQFDARGQAPVVGMVNGKKALTFTGLNGYRANFIMSSDYAGSAPFTVMMDVFNPNPQGTERIFGWTRLATADRGAAIFGYGTNASYGICNHWGSQNDMGFDRGVPKLYTWHKIVVTYSGVSAWEKVYVDGVLNALERKPDSEMNNIEFGGPVWIGCTDDPSGDQNFSGSLAALKVYPQEATWAEMNSLTGITTLLGVREHPPVVNSSFEAGLDWAPVLPSSTNVNMGDNRIIPGWCTAETWIAGSPAREGIGVVGKNLAVVAGGGDWDNGMNWDGNRVLALAGTDTAGQAISQWMTLRAGQTYRIVIHCNAKTGGSALMKVYVNGTQEGADYPVSPVDVAGVFSSPYYVWSDNITVPPVDGQYELKIEQANPGTQNILLLDAVEVINADNTTPMQANTTSMLCKTGNSNIDFGQVAAGGFTADKEILIRNLSTRTLDLWGYSRIGTDSGSIDLTDDVKPGTNSDNDANIRIRGYEEARLHVKFTSGSSKKTYSGSLRLRWRNGPYTGNYDMPWTALVPSSPQVRNGSFETPINSRTASHPLCYYNQLGDNVDIPYWCDRQDGIGVGERSAHPYVNRGSGMPNVVNGGVPDGRQALWIANTVGYYPRLHGVSQMIAGWTKNTTYTISLWAMSRNTSNWNPAKLVVRLNGQTLSSRNGANYSQGLGSGNNGTTSTIGAGDNPYHNPQYTFVAPNADNGMYNLEILGLDNGGQKALAIDRVEIIPQGSGAVVSMPQLPAGMSVNASQGLISRGMTINVLNLGGTTVTLSNPVITGVNGSQFRMTTTNTLPWKIGPFGSRYQVTAACLPRELGAIGGANLVLSTDATTTPTVTVPLYGNSVNYPTFANGSFELPTAYWANDGTWRCHLHSLQGGIPFWSQTGSGNENYGIAIPIDPTWQDLYWNNGAQLKGTQALWIETGTSNASGNLDVVHNLRQTVFGFYNGQTYTVTMYVNATVGGDSTVNWRLQAGRDFSNLKDLVPSEDLTAVAALGDFTKPFAVRTAQFVGAVGTSSSSTVYPDGSVAFQIQVPNQVDLSSLLVDAIEVQSDTPVNAIKSWASFE